MKYGTRVEVKCSMFIVTASSIRSDALLRLSESTAAVRPSTESTAQMLIELGP
jgi:hypothetical protein